MSQTGEPPSPMNYGPRCDAAIQAADQDGLGKLHDELRKKENMEESARNKSYLNYCLGNLCAAWSHLGGESAGGWRSGAFPVRRSNAIDHFRKTLKLDEDASFPWHHEARTNLGNELAHQGRGIEALAYWKPGFSQPGDGGFISALSRARELLWISHWLNDGSHGHLFQYEAYRQAKELDGHRDKNDHPLILSQLGPESQLRALIHHGDANYGSLSGWQERYGPEDADANEIPYREWCLKHRLFANPVNLLTDRWVAATDILQFPNHIVKPGEGPFLPAAFSAIKREYCFARFLAYEGVKGIHPAWENEGLYLTDTLDAVYLDGATEKLKTALRVCFGVFDSLVFLLNRYFQCGAAQCEFRPRWIKDHLGSLPNPFLDSLYWLACDLTDTSKIPAGVWKAPQAELSEIRKYRNAIEHGWLRVAMGSTGIWKSDSDFAETLAPDDLRRLVLLTLRVTRSALIYLTLAVKYQEESRADDAGPHLPIIAPLLDRPGEVSGAFGFGEEEGD